MSSAVAQRVAALGTNGEGSAASFDTLAALLTACPVRCAEACRLWVVDLALVRSRTPLLGADGRAAALRLLATLAEASPLAAAAVLGLRHRRGCAALRDAALWRAFLLVAPEMSESVEAEYAAAKSLAETALEPLNTSYVADCVDLLCDPEQGEVGDAAARLVLALLAPPQQRSQRCVQEVALAALFFQGSLLHRAVEAMRCGGVVEPDDAAAEASGAVRAAGRAASVLARALAAVPSRAHVGLWEDPVQNTSQKSLRPRLWPATLLCAWRDGVPQAAAAALAACRAPRLASTRSAGWAQEQRSRRATLGIAASALLLSCTPLIGDVAPPGLPGSNTVEAAVSVLAEHPGAFAGLVAGVHALCLLRGHVMHPLPPLLTGTGSRRAASAGPYTEVPPRQLLLSEIMHELMRSAVHWPEGEPKPPAVDELNLFSAEERGAGLSHAVLAAALQPYDDADTAYDREPDSGVNAVLWAQQQRRVGFVRREDELLPRPQHPALFQLETLATDAVMAAMADALPEPRRARIRGPSCGAHGYAALLVRAFLSVAPVTYETADEDAASFGFALRGLLHMLGRALAAGDASDFRVLSWLLSSPGDAAAAAGAFPGSEAPPSCSARWAAQRALDRRTVARAVCTVVRARLEGLAWVRAAESGASPDVSALDVADRRAAAISNNNMPHGASVLARMERDARLRIESRASAAKRDARDCLHAAAAWAALRSAQGRDVDGGGEAPAPLAAWQHAAYVSREAKKRRDALPYDNRYFSPAATAARVADARNPEAVLERCRALACQVRPPSPQPPPPSPLPQAPPGVPAEVTLLVGDVRFTAHSALLAASPLLDDMLRMHFADAAPDTPMRIALSADVAPDKAADAFALLMACLDAAEDDTVVIVAETAPKRFRGHRGAATSPQDPIVLPRAALPLASRDDKLRAVAPRLGPRIANPQLILPAWSAARHLQLDAVTDALADPLVEWLSQQEHLHESLPWHQAQAAVMAAPLDDELAHAVARAAVRFAARKLHASSAQGAGQDADDRRFLRLWLTGYAAWPLMPEAAMRKFCPDALARWVTALGRALHAEAALLLPAEARFGRAIGLARRAAQRLHTLEDIAAR